MSTILYILANIILPIFALLGVGVLFDRAFKPDLATLSKLNFYVFVPALVFIRLLDSQLSGSLVGLVVGFSLLHMLLLFGLSWLVFGGKRLRPDRPLLTAAALFNNSGNYGIPFAQLAFGDFGVQVMAFILVFQNVTTFTLGLWLLGAGRSGWKGRLRAVLTAPTLYAVVAALLLNIMKIELPEAIHFPLVQLSNGLVPIALLTLGVQLSRARWAGQLGMLTAATFMRLVAAPLLAFGMAWVWQAVSPAQTSQIFPVLVCAAALPVAVNVYILSAEFNHQPELASRIVFWSTLASSVTLTLWLVLFTK